MDVELEELKERYIAGYLYEMRAHPYAEVNKVRWALEDFDDLVYQIGDEAKSDGYSDGFEAAASHAEYEIKDLNSKILELKAKVAALDSERVAKALALLEKLAIRETPPVDDVEKWAYQDGWNDGLEKISKSLKSIES